MSEQHHARQGRIDAIHLEIETSAGRTRVGGTVVMDKPRLLRVDGIPVEVPLAGDLIYMRNLDVPGVIGHVGNVLGANKINIANFSLGREEREASAGKPVQAVAVVETDGVASDAAMEQLRSNSAVIIARTVSLGK